MSAHNNLNTNDIIFVNRIREMVSFELGEEIGKDVFRLLTSVEQKKNFWVRTRNRASYLRIPSPSIVARNPVVWGSIPHGDPEFFFFFFSRSWQDEQRLPRHYFYSKNWQCRWTSRSSHRRNKMMFARELLSVKLQTRSLKFLLGNLLPFCLFVCLFFV